MSRALALLLLLACGPEPDTDATDTDTDLDTDTDSDTEAPRSALVFPPEAEDLDDDPDIVRVQLTAEPHTFTIGEREVEGYAYNGSVPGPTIRAKVGDTVIAEITNGLDVPTTIHWHGAHVPYAYDGVTWTEDPIAPGETFTATFTVRTAGTRWYHPHFDTERQVDLGLYGALVVTDPADPPVDHDLVVIADAWGEHTSREPEDGMDHHGLDGADLTWTFNGVTDPELALPAGDTARLRVIDVSNTGYLDLRPTEGVRVIGGDQGTLAAPADQALLGPGDRTDLELLLGSEPESIPVYGYSLYGGTVGNGDEVTRLEVVPEGSAARPEALAWPFTGGSPAPDPGRTDLRFVLQGDAGADAWTINGETFPDVTVPYVTLGEELIVEVRNISPTDHPFHMHGHPFEVLSIDGEDVPGHPVEDTINVGIRQVVRLRFVADNPGFWMTHCHILPHADGGMMTVVEVGGE